MPVIKPSFISLDTSHLTHWIREALSTKESERNRAKKFSDWLMHSGTLILISMHHIEELCVHNDENTVLWRLRFLHSLPFVAWISDGTVTPGPSSITSIMRAEALAAFSEPKASIGRVRDLASRTLVRVGTGEELLGPSPDDWLLLREEFIRRSEHSRNLVAVAHSNVVDLSSKPLSELLNGRVRSQEDLERQLKVIEGSFAFDIAKHGDKRIRNPGAVARDFVGKIIETRQRLPDNAADLVMQSLAAMGVEKSDIATDMTVGQALDLGLFLQQMKIVTATADVSFTDLKRLVSQERVPSWVISSSLRQYAPPLPERKGSDLIDIHLACLSAYADVTLVDKRTLEAFRRAQRANPVLSSVCKAIKRAARYSDIPDLVGTLSDRESISDTC
ncbi:hypothetical protein EXN32_08005 [Agrobacterium tumefaciens]|uniref:hypothetical protein n=1 Tax=Agrobacterium TaxID=357 RepID=UPI00115E7902|nr:MULTISPECIES: hypothetical protein [Agrobacterium]MDA5245348.1 hypothetical protein [Agrobacterium sp. MAFF310724]MDA5246222.1 hypothetical protein [Agrobacterium sp. MAFF210268]TRB17659.1 hypothetical protein EXN32_08005 [Agrobacterium tumefaciens]